MSSHAPSRNRTNSKCEEDSGVFKKPDRLKFTGDEELNTSKMRMMDLVFWNPKKQEGLKRRDGKDGSCASSIKSGALPVLKKEEPSVSAPQVKIGLDGRLVIDESSLVMHASTAAENIWETVEEGRNATKITSMSFRKQIYAKTVIWSPKETDMFYEILRCTGPDFGLMHEFLPTRTRNELKQKYNREEKINWARINSTLSKPCTLDQSLYERCEKMQKEMKDEMENKKKQQKEHKELEKLARCNARLNEKERKMEAKWRSVLDEAKMKSLELDQLKEQMQESMRAKKLLTLYDQGAEGSTAHAAPNEQPQNVEETPPVQSQSVENPPPEERQVESESQESVERPPPAQLAAIANVSQETPTGEFCKTVTWWKEGNVDLEKEAGSIVRQLETKWKKAHGKDKPKKKRTHKLKQEEPSPPGEEVPFKLTDYKGDWNEATANLESEAIKVMKELEKNDKIGRKKRRVETKEQEPESVDSSDSEIDVTFKKMKKSERRLAERQSKKGISSEKREHQPRSSSRMVSYAANSVDGSSDDDEEGYQEEAEKITKLLKTTGGFLFNASKTDTHLMADRPVSEKNVDMEVEVEPKSRRMISRRKTRTIERLGVTK